MLIASASPSSAIAQTVDDVIESFPIDGNGGPLIIPVTVDNKEYPFVVDTGSTTSVFDRCLKRALKPTGKQVPMNGGKLVELCKCPTATVGRSKLKAGDWVISTNLADLRRQTGDSFFGILGMDFLKGKVLQIDFDAGKLSVLNREALVAGQQIALRVSDGDLPLVEVELPSLGRVPFILDTGCCGFCSGFLSKSTFDDLCRLKEIEPFSGMTRAIGILDGPPMTRIGVLARQTMSGFTHTKQIYTLDDSNESCNALGLGYLSRYKVTIDFHNWTVILEKGKWFDRACPANQAGIDLVMNEGVPVVPWVDANGPGWSAGIRPGDRILSVDGTDARDLKLNQIGEKLYWVRGGFSMKLMHAKETDSHDIRVMHKVPPVGDKKSQ